MTQSVISILALVFLVGPSGHADASEADTPDARLNYCMDLLDITPGATFEAKVVKVGPSLNRHFPDLGLNHAVILVDLENIGGNHLAVCPLKLKRFESMGQALIAHAGDVRSLHLDTLQHHEFELDTRVVGSVSATYGMIERTPPPGDFDRTVDAVGKMLTVSNDSYVVIRHANRGIYEDGRTRITSTLGLIWIGTEPGPKFTYVTDVQDLVLGEGVATLGGHPLTKPVIDRGFVVADVYQRLDGGPPPHAQVRFVSLIPKGRDRSLRQKTR